MFERDEPYYLSIGMTYEQYWYGDVRMAKVFRETDKCRLERINYILWLLGMYFFDASSCATQNGKRTQKSDPIAKYPEKPYDIFSKKEQKPTIDDGMTKEERELLIAKIMLDQERRASKQRWGGA